MQLIKEILLGHCCRAMIIDKTPGANVFTFILISFHIGTCCGYIPRNISNSKYIIKGSIRPKNRGSLIIAPYTKNSEATTDRRPLFFGLGFGILFGFLLHKGGATKYDVIVGQLLLTDFTVLKIMLSAVATGMIGVYFMKSIRHSDNFKHMKPT